MHVFKLKHHWDSDYEEGDNVKNPPQPFFFFLLLLLLLIQKFIPFI